MAESTPKNYSTDPALYLYTSLTSGSSHIVTATSRMETILKANRIPFRAIDIATDEKARMIWGRRAGKDGSGRVRKIPGLVQMGLVIGDLVEVEDWNEYGELKQHVTIYHEGGAPTRSAAATPAAQENKKPESAVSAAAPKTAEEKSTLPAPSPITLALRQVGQEAAQKAKDSKNKSVVETFTGVGKAEPEPTKAEKSVPAPVSLPAEKSKVKSVESLQSPNSTAWKTADGKRPSRRSIDGLESSQSPNSTAWKPTDVDGPILTHRGSIVSMASVEEIKQVEEEEAIQEEDEEDEEDDEEDNEEDDSDDGKKAAPGNS